MWERGTRGSREINLIFGEMGITWECKTLVERVVREWRKMYVFGM
jgi:hypothetical protein